MSHSPEPWKVSINSLGHEDGKPDNIFIDDCDGSYICTLQDHPVWKHLEKKRLINAERIVACVNACRCLPIEYLQDRLAEGKHFTGDGWATDLGVVMAKHDRKHHEPLA